MPNLCTQVCKNKLNLINYTRNQSAWITVVLDVDIESSTYQITVTFTGNNKTIYCCFYDEINQKCKVDFVVHMYIAGG